MAFGNAINSTVGAVQNGLTNTLTVTNQSNTVGAQARILVTVGGATAGDAFTTYNVTGTSNWSQGLDNSDSDVYVLSASAALGTTNVMRAQLTGEINYPLQPAFLAYPASTDSNVTGDGTVFNLGAGNLLTEVFDQNGDFATNGVFTAPVTGRYVFLCSLFIGGILAAHTLGFVQVVCSNRNFSTFDINPNAVKAVSGNMQMTTPALTDMDAGDIAQFQVIVSGGTKVIDVLGSTQADSYFSGYLAC